LQATDLVLFVHPYDLANRSHFSKGTERKSHKNCAHIMLDRTISSELQPVLGSINDDSAILIGEAHIDRLVGRSSGKLPAFRDH
jgi:hypothetical protein